MQTQQALRVAEAAPRAAEAAPRVAEAARAYPSLSLGTAVGVVQRHPAMALALIVVLAVVAFVYWRRSQPAYGAPYAARRRHPPRGQAAGAASAAADPEADRLVSELNATQ